MATAAGTQWPRRVFAAFHFVAEAFAARDDDDDDAEWLTDEERSLCALAALFAPPVEGELYARVDQRLTPRLRQYLVLELCALHVDHVLADAARDAELRADVVRCWQLLRTLDTASCAHDAEYVADGFATAHHAVTLERYWAPTTALVTLQRFVVEQLHRRVAVCDAPTPPPPTPVPMPVPLATLFDAQHAVWAHLQRRGEAFRTEDGHMMCTHMAMLRVYCMLRAHEPTTRALDAARADEGARDVRLAALFAVATLPSELTATPEVFALGRPRSDDEVARSERYAQQQRWLRTVATAGRSRLEAVMARDGHRLRTHLPLSDEDVFWLAYETACRARTHYTTHAAADVLAYPGELARRLTEVVVAVQANPAARPGTVRASLQRGADPRCLPWPRWPREPSAPYLDPSVGAPPLRAWRPTTPALSTLGMALEPHRVHDTRRPSWLPTLPWRLQMPDEPDAVSDDVALRRALDPAHVDARLRELRACAASVQRALDATPPPPPPERYAMVPRGTALAPDWTEVRDADERLLVAMAHVLRDEAAAAAALTHAAGTLRIVRTPADSKSSQSQPTVAGSTVLPAQRTTTPAGPTVWQRLRVQAWTLLVSLTPVRRVVRAVTPELVTSWARHHGLSALQQQLENAERELKQVQLDLQRVQDTQTGAEARSADELEKEQTRLEDKRRALSAEKKYLERLQARGVTLRVMRAFVQERRTLTFLAAAGGGLRYWVSGGTVALLAAAATQRSNHAELLADWATMSTGIVRLYVPKPGEEVTAAMLATMNESPGAPTWVVYLARAFNAMGAVELSRTVFGGVARYLRAQSTEATGEAVALSVGALAFGSLSSVVGYLSMLLPGWMTSGPTGLVFAAAVYGTYNAYGTSGMFAGTTAATLRGMQRALGLGPARREGLVRQVGGAALDVATVAVGSVASVVNANRVLTLVELAGASFATGALPPWARVLTLMAFSLVQYDAMFDRIGLHATAQELRFLQLPGPVPADEDTFNRRTPAPRKDDEEDDGGVGTVGRATREAEHRMAVLLLTAHDDE